MSYSTNFSSLCPTPPAQAVVTGQGRHASLRADTDSHMPPPIQFQMLKAFENLINNGDNVAHVAFVYMTACESIPHALASQDVPF